MGSCFSSPGIRSDESFHKSTANVVLANGNLRRYPIHSTASHVLHMEYASSSSSSSSSSASFFVCNSDRLYYEDYIPALAPEEELQAGQIYFILPASKLQYRLTAADMAALAVKASVALQGTGSSGSDKGYVRLLNKKSNKKKKTRISPLLLVEEEMNQICSPTQTILRDDLRLKKSVGDRTAAVGFSRSSSTRRLQRYSSKRAKMAVRSFRLKLTTIYEGSVLQQLY